MAATRAFHTKQEVYIPVPEGVSTVTGRPYPLRGSGERPPDGLPQ